MTGADDTTTEQAAAAPSAPLVLIRGEATAEEVAAVVAVLQGVAAASAPAPTGKPVPSAWSSPARKVRTHHSAGAGGWRTSALPR